VILNQVHCQQQNQTKFMIRHHGKNGMEIRQKWRRIKLLEETDQVVQMIENIIGCSMEKQVVYGMHTCQRLNRIQSASISRSQFNSNNLFFKPVLAPFIIKNDIRVSAFMVMVIKKWVVPQTKMLIQEK